MDMLLRIPPRCRMEYVHLGLNVDISEIWSCVSDATDRGIMNGSVVLLSSLTTSWSSACFRTVVRAFVQKFSS